MYILIPVCLLVAALFMYQEKQEKYLSAMILKGLASLCFVIFGYLASDGLSRGKLIVAGLILGCIADVLLNMRYVVKEKGQLVFLIGILVFLSGHIVYLAAVIPMNTSLLLCVIIGVILTALIMMWIFTKISAKKAFKIFGVFYIGAIVILNCVAIANCLNDPSAFNIIFASGALLFLISDIVLILNTFGSKSRFSLRVINLSLYYIGQLLIAFSILYLK